MFCITLRLLLTSLWISRFRVFFKLHRTVFAYTIDAGFRQNCALFLQSLFTDCEFYPVAFLFCYTVVFLTFFTAVTVIVLSVLLESGLWTISLKLFFLSLALCFFFWMNGEPLGTSTQRLLYNLDSPEIDSFGEGDNFMRIWLAFLSEKPGWVLKDGRTQEWRRVMICHLTHNVGK